MYCTNCGAEMQIDPERKQVFCSYCGTKLLVDDESVQITNRYVDEARLKEAEVRLRELEYEHERELREERLRLEQKKSSRLSVVVLLGALIITGLVQDLRPFFILVLVFGSIALAVTSSSDRKSISLGREGQDWYSPKSKVTTLILCIFFGELGVHYFYVGKIGMGILYLFTMGFCGVGWLIDIIRIACGTFRDKNGMYVV